MSIEKNMELLCLVARWKVIFHSTGTGMPLLRNRAVRSGMGKPPDVDFSFRIAYTIVKNKKEKSFLFCNAI